MTNRPRGSASGPAVRTTGLTKRFGRATVVDDVDMEVPYGSVFGFLGPNGAGKTTTVRMLLGLVRATSGTIEVLGRPMPSASTEVLAELGALIEGPAHYPFLTGRQNLERLAAYGHLAGSRPRVTEALERVGLSRAASKRVRTYSLGMRQRLGLAGALLRPARLLVLDEPTNGLDPQGTIEVRSIIRSLAGSGTTVVLSSHLLAEVEQVCTHVGMLSKGKLVTQGRIGALGLAPPRLEIGTPDPERAVPVLRSLTGSDPDVAGDKLVVALGRATPEQCCKALVEAGVAVQSLCPKSASLEDAFVALTGQSGDAI
ncbi:MAG: ABC transporter ATP-binding protein [Acidimicrobiales bacterium]